MSTNKKNKHHGSNFDDFLREEKIYEDVCVGAVKRVIAAQIAEALKEQNKSVSSMARDMGTSRAAVNRLLDENNHSLSFKTLARAASLLGKRLKLELVEA